MDYETLANMESVNKAISALRERGITALVVSNRDEALEKVKSLIGSAISKLLVFEREPSFMGRKAHIIFVNEKLGF